jgi:radical SAM superfamily enzyme YgiQ (UPF0313 family)
VRYTKDLLRAMAPLHRSGELREWSAETTLNVARDEELLDLFAEAGCSTLIIGFESISEATLLAMDKKVNFCLSYQEGIDRIHKRGMSIVGNFIVGFDTDTLSVFEDTLKFIDDNLILYPFFSILTPMPGTKLHDDVVSEGRVDHFDWKDYDTRHVVFAPKQMTREQLMDGYCYLYEQAYTSPRALRRLDNYWTRYRNKGSNLLERAYIKWRLRQFRNHGTPRFQRLLRDGWDLVSQRRGDLGQLLYYFDSGHFCDFLDRYRSPAYAQNSAIFRGEVAAPAPPTDTQWSSKRVKGSKSLAIVT